VDYLKTLVLYTSISGNTELIAQEIANELDAKPLKVSTNVRMGSGNVGLSWGDVKGLKGLPLVLEGIGPDGYDLVVIGTPIWIWSPSPVIHAFLLQHPIRDKDVAVFSTSGGDIGKGLDRLVSILKGNHLIGRRDFSDPKKDPEKSKNQARSWAREIASSFEKRHLRK
jgi:flavodoxin